MIKIMIWRIKHMEDNCNIVSDLVNDDDKFDDNSRNLLEPRSSGIRRYFSWKRCEWLAHVNPARMMREIWCVRSRLFPITHWSWSLTKHAHGWVQIYSLMCERFIIHLILSGKFMILVCFIIEKDFNCKIFSLRRRNKWIYFLFILTMISCE